MLSWPVASSLPANRSSAGPRPARTGAGAQEKSWRGGREHPSSRPCGWPRCRRRTRTEGRWGRADGRWPVSTFRWYKLTTRRWRLDQIGGIEAPGLEQGAELPERVGLDLAHALAAQRQALADRLQRFRSVAFQAEAAAEHGGLVGRQVVQHGQQIRPRSQQPPDRRAG